MRNSDSVSTAGRTGVFLLVIGWISAIISLIRYPFVFGVIGVIMGVISSKNGGKSTLALIVTSIICMALGLMFNGVLYNYLSHYLGF